MITNTLDLNAMGLISLNEAEMAETDGGILLGGTGILWGLILDHLDDIWDGFKYGVNAASHK